MYNECMKYLNGVLLVFAILGGGLLYMKHQSTSNGVSVPQSPLASVVIGGETFSVEIATTPEEQERGLSGRKNLPDGHGMLFWFLADGHYPFWMPDMNFPIDIVWIDRSWSIVHIEHDVSPASYPATFASPTPARYVLEIPSGVAEKLQLKIGQSVAFSEGNS